MHLQRRHRALGRGYRVERQEGEQRWLPGEVSGRLLYVIGALQCGSLQSEGTEPVYNCTYIYVLLQVLVPAPRMQFSKCALFFCFEVRKTHVLLFSGCARRQVSWRSRRHQNLQSSAVTHEATLTLVYKHSILCLL